MDEQSLKDEIFQINRNYFKPRSVIPEQSTGHYFCSCTLCETQRKSHPSSNKKIQAKEDYANYEGQEQSFTWLLHQLGKSSNDQPLKINIPETIVFRRSRPVFVIQQKQDRSLKLTSSSQKLKLQDLKKLISSASKQRKREDFAGHRISRIDSGYSKDVALVKYMHRDYDNESDFIHPSFEEGALKVMTELEFADLMIERPGSSIWKKICYIQSVVKCRHGLGEGFILTYYSHDANDAEALLELQKAGMADCESHEFSLINDVHRYAEFVCRKIAYVLAVNCQLELLRFCPEFAVDDNGKTWLVSASRISVKKIEITEKDQEVVFKKVELRSAESKERLNEELQAGFNEIRAPHQARMLEEMNRHYLELKNKMGIDEIFRQKPKDPKSNEAFCKLRPFSPYSIYQLIDPESLRRIEEMQKDRKKQRRIKISSRPFSRNFIEEKSRVLWTSGSKATASTRNLKTSSRYSQHLKSWLTPKKSASDLSLL
jgi:hypothetical protein